MKSQIDENEELVLQFKVARIFFAEEEEEEEANIVVSIEDITVRKRTEEEVQKKVKELEKFYDMAVGRELRMVELKEEIKRLESELKRYKNP
jgi:hypothetical protein